MLEDQVTEELIRAAIRQGTLDPQAHAGAHRLGLQEQGRAAAARRVVHYLPNPTEVTNEALELDKDEAPRSCWRPTSTSRSSALAFKLEDGRYGQLTYLRVYQGALRQGTTSSSTRAPARSTRSAAWSACTPTRWRTSPTPAPATSSPCSASTAPRATPSPTASCTWPMTVDARAGAGHLAGGQAEGQRVRDELLQGAAPLHQGGPDLPRQRRRGVRRDHHPRHGRAAPRGLHRAHEARVQGRGADLGRRRSPTARPSPGRPSSTTRTRSRPAARASTPRWAASSSRTRRPSTSSSTRQRAASSRASSSRRCEKGFKSMSRQGARSSASRS